MILVLLGERFGGNAGSCHSKAVAGDQDQDATNSCQVPLHL